MVGYGTFNNNKFIRLVTVNTQNTKEDILNFFKLFEEFTFKHHNALKILKTNE